VKGWEKLDRESGIDGTKREQGFVAMWFDESLREVFEKSIEPLSAETGFRMLRMDRKQFNDKICDQILKEIRRSRFVIADVTGHRQGVYFEAGFALGLGIPVIWTCRQSDLKDAHFDTRQYNHIVWKDGADLQAQLGDRIAATIGFARR
jgi:nucleoside 2-deoxyribosyltransferase